MKYESVLALKEEILGEIDKKLGVESSEAEFEFLRGLRPENRIAVGYSQISKSNFRLELRIQRRDQWAFRFAEEVVESTNGETNFEIIPKIEIPSGRETKATPVCTPIIDRPESLQIGLSIGTRDSSIGTLGAFLSRQRSRSPNCEPDQLRPIFAD